MYYECCVCKSSRQDAILHHFPGTEKRLTKCLECLNRYDLNKLSPEQLSKLFVCQKHFEKRFLTTKSRLVGKAYPSLFTEDEILSGTPFQDTAENVDPQTDHCYSRKRHFDHTYSKGALKVIITSGSSEVCNIPGPSQNSLPVQGTGLDKARKTKETKPRKRLIKKIKDLTPTCQMIYKEYKKARQQADFYRRAKKALRFCKEKSFEKLTENMNPYARRLMKMQINLCTKKKKGRRFTAEEKLIALSIMKQSPKCYRFLHKIFILPSKSTLNKMVSKLNVQTGVCPQVFDLMKKEVATWDEKKKMCSVIFDEMSLESALTYDKIGTLLMAL